MKTALLPIALLLTCACDTPREPAHPKDQENEKVVILSYPGAEKTGLAEPPVEQERALVETDTGPIAATQKRMIWVAQASLWTEASEQSAWIDSLPRGYQVDAVKDSMKNGFVRVMLNKHKSAFVAAADLLPDDVEQVLAFDNSPIFDSPEQAQDPKTLLSKGTPLFALEVKEDWVLVMLANGEQGWMYKNDLARNAEELTEARS